MNGFSKKGNIVKTTISGEQCYTFKSHLTNGEYCGKTKPISIQYGMNYLPGNKKAYFSITAVIEPRKNGDCMACGCLHDEIAKCWEPAKEMIP